MNALIKRRLRWAAIGLLGLTALVTIGLLQTASALEVDEDGIIEAGEVIDDDVFIEADHVVVDGTVNGVLIVSANSAEINGTVNGDLTIFAARATVSGQVGDNLVFGGQMLTLDGTVGGSVFAAGSSVALEPSAAVERSLLFGGFGLSMEEGSRAGRDVHVGAYQALFAGQIVGDLEAGTEALELEGTIGGDANVKVGAPRHDAAPTFHWLKWPGRPERIAPSGLRVSEAARIGGTLIYKSPVEQADGIESTSIGDVVFWQTEAIESESTLIVDIQLHVLERIREFLALLVLGGLVAWQAPRLLGRLADQAHDKPIPAALWGVAVLFAGVAGAVILVIALGLAMAVIGVITLGKLSTAVALTGSTSFILATTLFGLLIRYGSKLIVAYMVGRLILQRVAPKSAATTIWPLVLGIVLYTIVRTIPIAGPIIGLIVILIGLGAVWLLVGQQSDAPATAEP